MVELRHNQRKNSALKGKSKLPESFSSLCLVIVFLASCQLHNMPFEKSAVRKGYVISTNQELLYKGKIVGQSPPIEFYFVPENQIIHESGLFSFKDMSSFHELSICNVEVREIIRIDSDTLFYSETNDGRIEYSFISPAKLLIKKDLKEVKASEAYALKHYQISLNKDDTLDIVMNYNYRLVDLLNEY